MSMSDVVALSNPDRYRILAARLLQKYPLASILYKTFELVRKPETVGVADIDSEAAIIFGEFSNRPQSLLWHLLLKVFYPVFVQRVSENHRRDRLATPLGREAAFLLQNYEVRRRRILAVNLSLVHYVFHEDFLFLLATSVDWEVWYYYKTSLGMRPSTPNLEDDEFVGFYSTE